MECSIIKVLHASIVAGGNQLGYIWICQHQIALAKACVLQEVTLTNDKKQHSRIVRLSHGVCILSLEYLRMQMIYTFSQGLRSSGNCHRLMDSDIGQIISVVDCRIGGGLLDWSQPMRFAQWTSGVELMYQLWLEHITNCSLILAFVNHPWPTHNGQHMSNVGCPHRLQPSRFSADFYHGLPISDVLVHIAMLVSANGRQHRPSLVAIREVMSPMIQSISQGQYA